MYITGRIKKTFLGNYEKSYGRWGVQGFLFLPTASAWKKQSIGRLHQVHQNGSANAWLFIAEAPAGRQHVLLRRKVYSNPRTCNREISLQNHRFLQTKNPIHDRENFDSALPSYFRIFKLKPSPVLSFRGVRRKRDSNPRTCYSQQFSRLPQSTALPFLRRKSITPDELNKIIFRIHCDYPTEGSTTLISVPSFIRLSTMISPLCIRMIVLVSGRPMPYPSYLLVLLARKNGEKM